MTSTLRLGAALLLWLLTGSLTVTGAQGTNLLRDPGFEANTGVKIVLDGRNSELDGTIFQVPTDWDGWATTSPRSADWQNRIPDGYPHTGLFKIEGGRSWSISRGYATFTTAMFQRVTVAAGSNVRGSAQGFMERGQNDAGSTVPGGQFRVGIDPAGGNNPLSPSIVWSGWVTSPNGWVRASVDATAGEGGAVTLFLYSTQTQPSNPNAMYWDDASLIVGGEGGTAGTAVPGATPVPVVPTPAFAPFVAPQGTQPDGSVVHIVGSGDTIDAIAVAYQTTRQAILDLNPGLRPAFIFPGQEIIVRPPGSVGGGNDDEEGEEPESTTTGSSTSGSGANPAGTALARATASGTSASVSITAAAPTATEEVAATVETSETVTEEATAEPTAEPTQAPPTETPAPTLTPTDLPPAPVTQVASVDVPDITSLCVWVFEDANQNRIQEEGERLLPDAQLALMQGETIFREYSTDGVSEPFCFTDVEPGDYTAQATAPDGFGLTTSTMLNLRVQDGVRTNVRFGAAQGVESAVPPVVDDQAGSEVEAAPIQDTQAASDTDSLLQIAGLVLFGLAGLVVLGGIGVALYVRGR